MTMSERTPGIVGGVGPDATVDLFQKIVDQTPAETDADHVRVLIVNDPKIPSRYDAIMGDGESPGPAVAEAAQTLESMGADFLAIASNLTHYFYDDAVEAVDVPVLHMIETTVDWLRERYDVEAVGVLAPTPTLRVELYQDALERAGLEPVTLDAGRNERLVDESIYGAEGIKAGYVEANRPPLERAVETLAERGAEVTILGCTELPLALQPSDDRTGQPLVDANAAFAERIIEIAKKNRELP